MGRSRNTLVAGFTAIALVCSACGGDDDTTDGADATETTATDPPATDPPATDPPATDPPATDPPATDPPATDPPATDPPATDPPATDPPATDPPATDPPPPAAEGEIPQNNSGWALQAGGEDITAGPVVVYWYRGTGGGNYVAVYTGEGIAGAAGLGLCPGNSIFTTDFMNISNTPSEQGACDGFPTDTASLQVCDHGVWVYETNIPGDLEGFLFGSLEWNSAAGIVGLYSQAETMPEMGEFEAGLASYTVPPWFTDDGSSMIECADPIV